MNATLVATIAGIITAFCWGLGDWLSAKSTKVLGTVQINFGVSCVNPFVATVLLFFTDVTALTSEQLLAIVTASVLITVAYMVFVQALRAGPVGIIVPLGNSYPLITVGLSIVILSQAFNATQVGAMVGIVLGAGLLAYQRNRRQIPLKELHKDTILAIIAALIWGVAFFVLNSVVGEVAWQTIAFYMELTGFCTAILLLTAVYRSKTLVAAKETIAYPIILWCGVAGAVGFMALYIGSDRAGSIVIPTVLSGCGPLVASGLGAMFDHERLGALKRVGAVLVVAGIIVLNLA